MSKHRGKIDREKLTTDPGPFSLDLFALPFRTTLSTFLIAYGDVSALTKLPLVARIAGFSTTLGPASMGALLNGCKESDAPVKGRGSDERKEVEEALADERLVPSELNSPNFWPLKANLKLGEGGRLKMASAAEGGGRKTDCGDAS